MDKCYKCKRVLTADEVGLHRRLMDRAAEEFMCITCLAEFFGCDEKLLRDKIAYFKKTGCTMFECTDKE